MEIAMAEWIARQIAEWESNTGRIQFEVLISCQAMMF